MIQVIHNHLEWLNANGAILTSSELDFSGLTIDFHKREDGSWYYNAPW